MSSVCRRWLVFVLVGSSSVDVVGQSRRADGQSCASVGVNRNNKYLGGERVPFAIGRVQRASFFQLAGACRRRMLVAACFGASAHAAPILRVVSSQAETRRLTILLIRREPECRPLWYAVGASARSLTFCQRLATSSTGVAVRLSRQASESSGETSL